MEFVLHVFKTTKMLPLYRNDLERQPTHNLCNLGVAQNYKRLAREYPLDAASGSAPLAPTKVDAKFYYALVIHRIPKKYVWSTVPLGGFQRRGAIYTRLPEIMSTFFVV